jgi:hypothetical protein
VVDLSSLAGFPAVSIGAFNPFFARHTRAQPPTKGRRHALARASPQRWAPRRNLKSESDPYVDHHA